MQIPTIFELELSKLIAQAIENIKETSVAGLHPPDQQAKYVGQVEALRLVKTDLFDMARELADQSNR